MEAKVRWFDIHIYRILKKRMSKHLKDDNFSESMKIRSTTNCKLFWIKRHHNQHILKYRISETKIGFLKQAERDALGGSVG